MANPRWPGRTEHGQPPGVPQHDFASGAFQHRRDLMVQKPVFGTVVGKSKTDDLCHPTRARRPQLAFAIQEEGGYPLRHQPGGHAQTLYSALPIQVPQPQLVAKEEAPLPIWFQDQALGEGEEREASTGRSLSTWTPGRRSRLTWMSDQKWTMERR